MQVQTSRFENTSPDIQNSSPETQYTSPNIQNTYKIN